MTLSSFLAEVIGWYFIIISLLILVRHKLFETMAREIHHNTMATTLTGALATIIGLLLVVSHSIWAPDWRVIITLVAWIILLKGISRLFFPNQTRHLAIKLLQHTSFSIIKAFILLFLGIYLLYCAYTVPLTA